MAIINKKPVNNIMDFIIRNALLLTQCSFAGDAVLAKNRTKPMNRIFRSYTDLASYNDS
jgi:hypothetical protein